MHRLDELRRQRALLQEHLAWLDREIADCSRRTQTPAESLAPIGTPEPTPGDAASAALFGGDPASAALPSAAKAATPSISPPAPTDADADTILADYQTPASKLQQDVRLGCFLYFAAALVAVAAGVVVLYFLLRHR